MILLGKLICIQVIGYSRWTLLKKMYHNRNANYGFYTVQYFGRDILDLPYTLYVDFLKLRKYRGLILHHISLISVILTWKFVLLKIRKNSLPMWNSTKDLWIFQWGISLHERHRARIGGPFCVWTRYTAK